MTASRVLLGPQNPVRNIGAAVHESGIPDGPLAVISAGWQEAEGDIDELQAVVGRPLEDVSLYRRAEALFREDEEFYAAYRARQDKLKKLQQLYRIRLRSLSIATRRLQRVEGDEELLKTERRHAVQQLQALDSHHLEHCEEIHTEFEHIVRTDERESVLSRAAEMIEVLDRTSGVVMTGGNVAVLINRLRLFGLGSRLRDRHVLAWSAAAMALTDRIVLFHERMPQGRREPEIFGRGLGLVSGAVVFPDAAQRLRAGDRMRVRMMARRFAPDACVTLNNGSSVRWEGERVVDVEGARRLTRDGRLGPLRAP